MLAVKTLPFCYRGLFLLGEDSMPWILAKKKKKCSKGTNESYILNNGLVTVILESHWRRRCVYNTCKCIHIFVNI